ncbi:MAG: hypothetical protein HQL93_01220 [Magnetococcales bacterium]|nr:hypothetical protein [Magnetococcales bacterium]
MNTQSRGAATLLASLIILVLLTMIVVSSMNVSTVNFGIVGNLQTIKTMDSATQQALDTVMSQGAHFTASMPTYTFRSNSDIGTIAAPTCIDSQISSGNSASWTMAPRDNTWELTATITNTTTGAVSTIHQGTQIRQLAGVCYPE